MSDFEVLFTGVAIVLALAVARLLEGLRDTFDQNRRYWIHYVWVVNRFLFVMSSFWAGFEARQLSNHDFFLFVIAFTPPAVVFVQVNALVTPQPGTIEDWKVHFWSVRKWFFGSNMVLVLGVFLLSTYGLSAESGGVSRYAPPAMGLLLSIVGYRSSSERVHGVLAVVGILNVAMGFGRMVVLL